MTVHEEANLILDMARAGADVPSDLIALALVVTGDASTDLQPVHQPEAA